MFNKSGLYFIILFMVMMDNITLVAAQDNGPGTFKMETAVTDSIDWLSPEFSKDLDTLCDLTRHAAAYGLSRKEHLFRVIPFRSAEISTQLQ
jgi:hypothetical protein